MKKLLGIFALGLLSSVTSQAESLSIPAARACILTIDAATNGATATRVSYACDDKEMEPVRFPYTSSTTETEALRDFLKAGFKVVAREVQRDEGPRKIVSTTYVFVHE